MFQQPFRTSFGIASLLGLAALVFSASACSRSEARRPAAEPEAVMQAVRGYGRGHQALLVPGSAEKPDESDEAYSAHIRNILVQEDFAQLEKIAQQNRVEKGRLLGGVWKTYAFYTGTSRPASRSRSDGIRLPTSCCHPEEMDCGLSELRCRSDFSRSDVYE